MRLYQNIQQKKKWSLASFLDVGALSVAISFSETLSFAPSIEMFLISLVLVFLVRNDQGHISVHKSFWYIFFILFFRAMLVWAVSTFPLEFPENVIATLQMPIDGFVFPFVKDFLLSVLSYCFIFAFLLIHFTQRMLSKVGWKGGLVILCAILFWNVLTLWIRVPIVPYWNYFTKGDFVETLYESRFYEDNVTVVESLPETDASHKNLVLIMMESMENWPREYISELNRLFDSEVSFSDIKLGGVKIFLVL